MPPPSTVTTPAPLQDYHGNKYDLYALVAGTLGGTVIAMCASGNLLWYCLPIAPLVLGIIAMRNARTSLDPLRTRNLAWIGIAGGGLGTLLLICMFAFFALYFSFIIAALVVAFQSAPRH
jgi:hypothetical protein